MTTSHSREAERTTKEVAAIAGISVDLLRKYKARGFLKLAPPGVAGQGRGVECRWSQEAVDELKSFIAKPRSRQTRYKRPTT